MRPFTQKKSACYRGALALQSTSARDVCTKIQEPIFDEGDPAEWRAMEYVEWAFRTWQLFVKRRRK